LRSEEGGVSREIRREVSRDFGRRGELSVGK